MDVTFREDERQIRIGGGEDKAVAPRCFAFNLLRQERTAAGHCTYASAPPVATPNSSPYHRVVFLM